MKTLTTSLTIGLLIVLTAALAFSMSKIYGVVEQLPEKGHSGTWVVHGRKIAVTKDTILKQKHGRAEVGAYVEVEGTHAGKTFTAHEIEVKRTKEGSYAGSVESKFYGTVENLPKGFVGTWVVSGREIFVSKDTLLKEKHGKVEVGAAVEVKGAMSGETFNAHKIEVKK